MKVIIPRFGKFAVVGVLNTVLALAVFNLLIVTTQVPAPAANAIAYLIGIANSYYWNRRWTFRDRAHLTVRRTLPRFVATNLAGLVITTSLVALLERAAITVGALDVAPRVVVLNVVELVAILVGLAWNYFGAHRWAFSGDRGETSGAS